jgi:ABC-type transport system involved in cytochrome c biogenesis ATPase subunit
VYRSIEITNYRCFDHLKVKDLARVNIICGANNSGKTALLEAIYLHAMRGHPSAFAEILRQRAHSLRPSEGPADEPVWSTLFAGFDGAVGCRIEADEEGASPESGPRARPTFRSESRRTSLRVREQGSAVAEKQHLVRGDGKTMRLQRAEFVEVPAALAVQYLEDGLPVGVERQLDETHMEAGQFPDGTRGMSDVAFVPARAHSAGIDALRFKHVALAKQTPDIVEAMNTVEPRLRDLRSVPGSAAIYGEVGLPRLMPLPDMGDGMQRLLSFTLALWTSRGGVVLIDEVESGLHHSVLNQVWRLVGEAARRFDVQVFATTHSWECIVAAHQAFRETSPDDLRVHRIEHLNGKVRDVVYGDEDLEAAFEIGAEVR